MIKRNLPLELMSHELNCQLHCVQKNLKNGAYHVDNLGSILPAAVIMHDLEEREPMGVHYMNDWGCERLGTSAKEVNALGDEYYEKYFLKEETIRIFIGMAQYLQNGDPSQQYNFFQRVKLYREIDYKWFYSVCKIFPIHENNELKEKIIVLSSPVEGVGSVISKVNQVLDENIYIKKNYRVFAALTKSEKRIIAMLVHGKSSKEIAEELHLSVHTVSTHRKNIIRKTECVSFASLLRFAISFDLL